MSWPSPKLTFNNKRAYSEGWGLFSSDSGLQIMKLDDPPSVGLDVEPAFQSDDEALYHVMERCREGSRYHKKAVKLAAKL